MINLIINNIVQFKLNGLFKKISSQESKFNSFLKGDQNILIFLPNSEKALKQSEKVFEFLLEQNKNLSVFSNMDTFEKFRFKNQCHLIEYRSDELTKLKLPNEVFKKRIASSEYKVCIDLSREHVKFNMYIMGLIKSPYRIGIKDGEYDKYFNLLIDKINDAESDAYLSMISSLKMFL